MDINAYLLDKGFAEVSYKAFYRDVFPKDSFEEKAVYETGKYNGIIIEVIDEKKTDGKQKILRHTLTDELDKLDEVVGRNNFCLMSPISYAGKSRKSEYARFLYAIAIDLDGITSEHNLDVLFKQIVSNDYLLENKVYWGLPKPSYFVSSGTGLHLYYVFEKAVPLFRNVAEQLEILKRRLTWQAWTQGASELYENVQYESLFQGFRMVGTVTKAGNVTRAFKYGDVKKYTVEELNRCVPEEYRVKSIVYQSNLTLAEAKEKYPEWYEKRIVKKQPKGSWTCNRALYDWWIRKIYEGAAQGHRYWCILTLAAYAKKCDIDYDELVADSIGLIDFLNSKGDAFTIDDVMKALEAYNDGYITYPIDTIVARTDIPIKKNKRNGRKQDVHIKTVNAMRKFRRDELGEDEYKNNGRPVGSGTAEQKVQSWRAENPNGRKADCVRDTGLSKPTVYKWWEVEPVKTMQEQADELIFMESEMTLGLLDALTRNGVRRVNVVPDDEYQSDLFDKWLQEQFPKKDKE